MHVHIRTRTHTQPELSNLRVLLENQHITLFRALSKNLHIILQLIALQHEAFEFFPHLIQLAHHLRVGLGLLLPLLRGAITFIA